MESLHDKTKEQLIEEIKSLRLQLNPGMENDINELKEHKERYDLANKATKDGIYDWNLVTNEIYYNLNYKRMLGYEDEELANDFSIWETNTLPEDVQRSWQMQNDLITKKRDRFVMEFKMKHKKGHWVDILSRAEAVFDATGKAVRIVGTHVDITEKIRAIEALKKSEERFRTLANMAPIGIFQTNIEGHCIYANPRWLQMTGLSMDEARGSGWLKGVHEHDRDEVETSWYHSKHTGGTWKLDFRFKTAKGKVTWVTTLADPITNADEKLDGYIGINLDITEAREALIALEDNKNFLDKVINSSALSTWIADAKGTAIHVNPACLEFFGATEEEVVGKYNILNDEVIQEQGLMPEVEKVFTQATVANIVIDYNFGAVNHVDVKNATHKIINSIITPVTDAEANVHYAIIQSIDLTDIKNAEKQAIAEKTKAQQYLDIAEVMLVSIDTSGRVQLINPKGCEILGYSKSDIIGQNWFDLCLPDSQRTQVKEVAKKVFAGELESVKYYENNILTKSGEERLIAFRNSLLLDEEGNIIGTLSSGEDITERKQIEEELEKYRADLEQMVAQRTKELNHKNKELDDALKVFVGRELSIKELQNKILDLEKRK